MNRKITGFLALTLALLAACGDDAAPCEGASCAAPPASCSGVSRSTPPDQGRVLSVALPPGQQQQLDALSQQLGATAGLTADQLLTGRALPFASELSYDPLTAAGLDLIEQSMLAPSEPEKSRLAARGFSISTTQAFPTFTYGYAAIYQQDLPLYISADSLLYAVHKSYDKGLEGLELELLRGDVSKMLATLRAGLGSGAAGWMTPEARADLDLFLAVGLGLLDGQPAAPVAGGDQALLTGLLAKANAGQGTATIRLFGQDRDLDFSQFTPRGHYTDSDELKRYFRAMMWFGRIEFRLIETDEGSGQQVFRRRQLEAALGLSLLLGDARASFERVDQIIGLFVGEHDSMTPVEGLSLLADLGLTDGAGLAALGDEVLAQKLVDGGYGAQRIASQLAVNGAGKTLPLHRSFQLFGQRYTVDAHVFSNVVYDRAGGGAIKRMMPSPLDAAFAAFGNDQAAQLLAPELQKYPYAPDLSSMRLLVDAHEPAYWEGSLYTLWLSSLRALSPSKEELADPKKAGLPQVAATEAWGRRLLNTQLASWAELRHDTLLYAKQSYSKGATCEFPDAYVDPYPAFYAALARYAERGQQALAGLSVPPGASSAVALKNHLEKLHTVSLTLRDMAEQQRTGQPFNAEQMAFVNQAVKTQKICGSDIAEGWYPSLFLSSASSTEYDPTIADVHTQPTDEAGNTVGKVLHVATRLPRRAIITVETCAGPRAYVGLVSSYHEKTTEDFRRLTDEEWAASPPPAEVPWMDDLLGP